MIIIVGGAFGWGGSGAGLRVRGTEPTSPLGCQSGSPTPSCHPVPCGTLRQNIIVQNVYMGHFPQDGENEQNVSFF